jgi:hypothetical protein
MTIYIYSMRRKKLWVYMSMLINVLTDTEESFLAKPVGYLFFTSEDLRFLSMFSELSILGLCLFYLRRLYLERETRKHNGSCISSLEVIFISSLQQLLYKLIREDAARVCLF